MTSHRIEVDVAFNVRPSKGERRAKDGTGRLVKAMIYHGTHAECMEDILAYTAGMSGGSSEILEIREYDFDAYYAWAKVGGEMPKPHTFSTVTELTA
ncbi:MAG: hypothetical protein ACAH27_05830 [Xanthobacteraceae bacterium]